MSTVSLLVSSALLLVTASSTVAVLNSFDDTIVRTKLMPLSAAAYSDRPQNCLNNAVPGAVLLQQVTVPCDAFKDKCSGFVALSAKDKAIMVSFRGTDHALQLFLEVSEAIFTKQMAFPGGGKVSEYFYNGFMDIWKGGMANVLEATSKIYPEYQLWITGHSLGASFASLAATFIADAKLFPAEQIRLVTFGQPRTGDKEYANSVDRLIPHSFRVTHNRDIVAHIPPPFLGYRHHSTEIFYPNNMNAENTSFKTCQQQEDKKCSDGHVDLSIADHTHYYGHDISDFADADCK